MATLIPKGRWRRRLAVSAVLLVVLAVVVPLGGRWWALARANRALAAAVAVAAADDPDWRWDDLNAARPRPPAGKNGADVVASFQSQVPTNWAMLLELKFNLRTHGVPPNVRYPASVYEEAGEELDGRATAVAAARSLRDYPTGHKPLVISPDFDNTSIGCTNCVRPLVAVLGWAAERDAHNGRAREALSCVHAALNASRSVGDEPMMIAQLVRASSRTDAVRILERVLAHGEPPAADLAELQAVLAAEADEPLILYALKGERAGTDVMMRNVAAGVVPVKAVLGDPPAGLNWGGTDVRRWSAADRIVAEHAKYLRATADLLTAARLPTHEQPAAFATVRAQSVDVRDTPLVGRNHTRPEWFWESAAYVSCAAVGVSCERFRLQSGRWPNGLTELVPDLLPRVPPDPFDGKPLRYRRTGGGVMVYSVGTDAADDGGIHRAARFEERGTDIVFRLYDPGRRGLPPPPEEAPEPREVTP